jgi:hypothetical protein
VIAFVLNVQTGFAVAGVDVDLKAWYRQPVARGVPLRDREGGVHTGSDPRPTGYDHQRRGQREHPSCPPLAHETFDLNDPRGSRTRPDAAP